MLRSRRSPTRQRLHGYQP
ncbi:hypothetical protein CIB84_013492 [Bambusicola thoracicus]|uniref:Uncharacterized protein n=1 Tax=Bambusicola thoracicus TaxID=9083 RepID=A0A2P4SF65_BAMTH|nr:hypothetical protein CIB84_013492 [Bambusicola thoracicus]